MIPLCDNALLATCSTPGGVDVDDECVDPDAGASDVVLCAAASAAMPFAITFIV